MAIPKEIVNKYQKLASLPVNADGDARRRRGFDFERLLNAFFTADDLEPRTSYRPAGEQIDGSFYLDGKIYLFEAKWHADPLPASILYEFKGKVDGKLVGTIGVFISMSGYSKDAVDGLIRGKSLNVILLDNKDIDAAITKGHGFKNIFRFKVRKAAEEGAIYFPSEVEIITAIRSESVEIAHLRYDQSTDSLLTTLAAEPVHADLVIVCEGETDRVVITTLAERILSCAGSNRSITIVVAMGKFAIPSVVNALRSHKPAKAKTLIVVDGDGDPAGTIDMLNKGLKVPLEDWIAAVPNPSIENWLNLDPVAMRRWPPRVRAEELRNAAALLDFEQLRRSDEQFVRLYDAVLGKK